MTGKLIKFVEPYRAFEHEDPQLKLPFDGSEYYIDSGDTGIVIESQFKKNEYQCGVFNKILIGNKVLTNIPSEVFTILS